MIIIPFAFECPGKALTRTPKCSLQVYRRQIVTSVKTSSENTSHNQKLFQTLRKFSSGVLHQLQYRNNHKAQHLLLLISLILLKHLYSLARAHYSKESTFILLVFICSSHLLFIWNLDCHTTAIFRFGAEKLGLLESLWLLFNVLTQRPYEILGWDYHMHTLCEVIV